MKRRCFTVSLVCVIASFVLFALFAYINVMTYGRFFVFMPVFPVVFLASGFSAVFFTNPATFVQVSGAVCRTPVFIQSAGETGKLLAYIAKRDAVLSDEEVANICRWLESI